MKRRIASTMTALAAALAVTVTSQAGQFDPPNPVDLGGGTGAGPWFYGTSGSNWDFSTIPGAVIGGTGSDNIKATLLSSGPLNWQDVRHNEGDIALGISPFVPADAYTYPDPNSYLNNYAPGGPGPETSSWRVNQANGGLFASVRVNGHDNGDTIDGSTPVGTVWGISYFNDGFGQGNSYHPLLGSFTNGGTGSSDLQIGILGSYTEGVIPTATASLPYGQGWLGGWVNGTIADIIDAQFNQFDYTPFGGVDPVTVTSASPKLSASSITWASFDANAHVDLSSQGFSPETGMLFVAPTSGDNNTKIAASTAFAGGWNVTIREDDSQPGLAPFDGVVSSNTGAAAFQMMYIDYDAPGLIGGQVNGADGSLIHSAGGLTVTRTGVGTYEVTIPGKTGDDGMLMLSIADSHPNDAEYAGRGIASFEYNSDTGKFVVNTVELTGPDVVSFLDSGFYLAWVDFSDPFQPWIDGDADIDGKVDGLDYLTWAGNFGKSEDAIWFDGDFVHDGTVDGLDYLAWASNYGTNTNASVVPEPGTFALAGIAALLIAALRRRR
ncbi:MAG: PEP-CTERM sorting domain-containing protein [Planctomycetales bacterium]|nr:PEP-CTERM sorting domain-containing protein [Planctomycetales bacterium]